MVNLTEISKEDHICVVCELNAPHKCSGCKQVHYCSKDHQKQHWKIHKAECRAIEVKSSPDLGRFLVANRDADENDILFMESPLVFGPKLMNPTPMCLGCYRPLQSKITARCPSCFWPACDRSCPGLTDPRHHALECLVLSLNPLPLNQSEFPRYEIISPLRTLLLQKRNPNKWQQVLSMEAHMDKRGPKTYAYQYLEEKVTVFLVENYLSRLDESALSERSNEIIHKICGIFEVNALEVCFGSMDLLALYSNACTMEHNCMPNTVHHFDSELRITVRPARKIAKNDHLSTMYTNILWGTQARREHLKETKYFDCKCQRCRDPTELGSYLSAFKCHGNDEIPCNGWQLPIDPLNYNSDWKCNVCPVMLISEEAKSLEDMLEQEVESVKKSQFKIIDYYHDDFHPEEQAHHLMNHYLNESEIIENVTVENVNEILNTLDNFLHPNHYQCYEMKHLLIQLYGNKPGFSHKKMTNAELKRKIDVCRDLLSVSSIIDPTYGHLTLYVAVLMFELHGALLEMDSRMKTDSYQEIKELLKTTIKILKHEPSNTPGSELRLLAEKSLTDVQLKN